MNADRSTEREPAATMTEVVRRFYDDHHQGIERHRQARRYYYAGLRRMLEVRIPPGLRVLDIGCGAGDLLAALRPSVGVGIDLSARAVAAARAAHPGPQLTFSEGDAADPAVLDGLRQTFDVVLLVNVVSHLEDVQATFEGLHAVLHPGSRVLVYSYSRLWQPALRLAEVLRLKYRQPTEAWLPPEEIEHLLGLADFEVVRRDRGQICPFYVPLVSDPLNRFVGHLPIVDVLSFTFGLIARPAPHRASGRRATSPTVSVIIPCRNEAGHVPELARRLPELPQGSEFLFVEGNSQDDTVAAIERAIANHPEKPLRLLRQQGKGKGDAVRLGFGVARGDILLILDSDMGVAPETIPKFVDALVRGKGDLINGSRLVYPMEGKAMRFLNLLANKAFAWLFTWLLGQQVRDTLCGTKVLSRLDYERIEANRSYFGDFDPFGDFDLLFGAARLNMRIADLAIRYNARRYGATNISRFRHGVLLLRMSLFAARKLKFI
jgi:SAM-dependent methyltransferase